VAVKTAVEVRNDKVRRTIVSERREEKSHIEASPQESPAVNEHLARGLPAKDQVVSRNERAVLERVKEASQKNAKVVLVSEKASEGARVVLANAKVALQKERVALVSGKVVSQNVKVVS
jgi:hypothetical protein